MQMVRNLGFLCRKLGRFRSSSAVVPVSPKLDDVLQLLMTVIRFPLFDTK